MMFPMRKIRSFVRRDSRMTDSQREAFDTLWPQYGLNKEDGFINLAEIFPREGPHVLEIGFGSGYSLLEMAKQHPEQNFIGIEMYQPGIGALLLGIRAFQLKNLRVFYADAVEVLTQCIPDNALEVIQIFFPDPWPKRKHHKRRLIQPELVDLLVKKIKMGGTLHLATDWEDYAKHMMKVLSNHLQLENLAGINQYADRSSQRPVITKFEQRGHHSGRPIRELQFTKGNVS